MGGYGTWDLLCRRPEVFAAEMPVCGGGDVAQAAKIAKVPIAAHGAAVLEVDGLAGELGKQLIGRIAFGYFMNSAWGLSL